MIDQNFIYCIIVSKRSSFIYGIIYFKQITCRSLIVGIFFVGVLICHAFLNLRLYHSLESRDVVGVLRPAVSLELFVLNLQLIVVPLSFLEGFLVLIALFEDALLLESPLRPFFLHFKVVLHRFRVSIFQLILILGDSLLQVFFFILFPAQNLHLSARLVLLDLFQFLSQSLFVFSQFADLLFVVVDANAVGVFLVFEPFVKLLDEYFFFFDYGF